MAKIMLIASKDNNFYNFRSELILELQKRGNEVVLVCPYGKKIDYFTERGCRFIDINMDRRGTNIIADLHLLNNYIKTIGKEKPDVVLTYTTKSSVYGGMACRLHHVPYIVNNAGLIESDNPKSLLQKLLRQLYRVGFKKASCMMYQNTRERDYVNTLLNNRVHFRDIPGSGVNLYQFAYKKYPENDSEVIFNYVARVVGFKGINEFIECAKRVRIRHPETRFIIYGDYDDDSYRTIIEDLQEKHIVEYGGIQMDMRPYIEKSHAVIHASYYEGMTNVVLEHSAMGRPCIGSNIPGVKEGIDDEKTGFLFEVKNVDALVNAVERFLKLSNKEKANMGKSARHKMESEFDRRIVTDIYIEEIRKVLRI